MQRIINYVGVLLASAGLSSAASTAVAHFQLGEAEFAGTGLGNTPAALTNSLSATSMTKLTGTSAPIAATPAPAAGSAYALDCTAGSTSYQVADNFIHSTTGFLVEGWAKPTSATGFNTSVVDGVFSYGNGGTGYIVGQTAGFWGVYQGAVGQRKSTAAVSVGAWTHIALAKGPSDTNVTLYVNYVAVLSFSPSGSVAAGSAIGDQYTGGGFRFHGPIDDVWYSSVTGNFNPATDFKSIIPTTATPTFSPPAGSYSSAQTVTVSSETGSTVYYTTDGSTPTTSSSNGGAGTGAATVNVPSTLTINALATIAGKNNSVATAGYAIVSPAAGIWSNNAGGTLSWMTAGNWSGGVIANGSNNNADFSTLTLAADATVTLDAPLSIGNLAFDDGNATKKSWTLNPGSGGPLTLAVSSGTPVITTGAPTTIGVALAGTQGLNKAGSGTLTLGGTATNYSGATTVNAGTLSLNGNFISFASAIAVNPTASLQINNPLPAAVGVTLADATLAEI